MSATIVATGLARLQGRLREIAVGVICGLVALVMAIGNGNLLFSGPLKDHVGVAIGMALFSTGLLAAVAVLTSSVRNVISASQATPIVAVALPVNLVAGQMQAPAATIAATATAAVVISTILVGAVFLLLGLFRLGRFVRFVPFPVVGGFLAGTGWLILIGGAGIVLGRPVTLDRLQDFLVPAALAKAATALALVVLVAALEARIRHRLVLPAVILLALALFQLTALAAGIGVDALQRGGWLVSLGDGALWPPLGPADLGRIDWRALAQIVAGAPVMATVTVLALLMNMSGLEIATRRDIDLDVELRAAGVGNLLGGLGGGAPGYQSLSMTLLAERLSAGGTTGLIVALLSFAALAFGGPVLDAVPTPIFGGVLVWVGGSLLREWLVVPAFRLSRWEYLTILLIFAVIVLVGFAWGIAVGILAAVVLFVIEYGRVEIVRHILTGREYQSSLEQSEQRREALRRHGDAILIVRLHGFLFFGTADRLRRNLERRVAGRPVRYLLIDFRRVSGLDSSAILSFIRLGQSAERDGYAVLLTGLSPELQQTLARGGLAHGEGSAVRFAADLDHVLEQCENELLAAVEPDALSVRRRALAEQLRVLVPGEELTGAMLGAFEPVAVPLGGTLVEQGSASDDLFLIEAGRAAVMLGIDGGRRIRLAAIGPGAIVGEISFYLGKPRTASIVAEEPVTAWRLSRASLSRLEAEVPALAAHFHRGVAAMLAERLAATNRLVRFLAD